MTANLLININKQITKTINEEPKINPLFGVLWAKIYATIGNAAKIVKR